MLCWKIVFGMPQLASVALPRRSCVCVVLCAFATDRRDPCPRASIDRSWRLLLACVPYRLHTDVLRSIWPTTIASWWNPLEGVAEEGLGPNQFPFGMERRQKVEKSTIFRVLWREWSRHRPWRDFLWDLYKDQDPSSPPLWWSVLAPHARWWRTGVRAGIASAIHAAWGVGVAGLSTTHACKFRRGIRLHPADLAHAMRLRFQTSHTPRPAKCCTRLLPAQASHWQSWTNRRRSPWCLLECHASGRGDLLHGQACRRTTATRRTVHRTLCRVAATIAISPSSNSASPARPQTTQHLAQQIRWLVSGIRPLYGAKLVHVVFDVVGAENRDRICKFLLEPCVRSSLRHKYARTAIRRTVAAFGLLYGFWN